MADPIVKLNITVSDKAPAVPSFGVPLIAGKHTRFPELVREYSEASDMLTDGFTTSDPEYQMALVLKAQLPTVNRFKVGRLVQTTWSPVVHLTPTNATAGLVYSGVLNSEDIPVTVAPSDTEALIVDKVVLAASGIPGATVTDGTTHAIVTGSTDKILSLANLSEYYTVLDATTINSANLQADLTAINNENSDWYGLILTINSAAAITAAAAWVEANKKIYAPMSADSGVINPSVTNDILSSLVALGYERTALIYHPDIGGSQWANAAWMAVNCARDPGSYTPAFKELKSIRTANLKQSAITALQAKNGTRYTREYGINMTYEGKTPSGRYWDVVRFLDWMDYTIKADYHAFFANNDVVPFGSKGLTLAKGVLDVALKKGVTAGGFDGVDSPPLVFMPAFADTTVGERASRVLKNVSFTARGSGALHGLEIQGNVSV